jgi:nitrous oxidase accessory protein
MGKSAALLLVTVFLVACILVIPPAKASPKTIVVPDNYSTIQDAIDNATAGDTIFVRSGNYNQNLTINKALTLIGQNTNTAILTCPQLFNSSSIVGIPFIPVTYVINITANDVKIRNFTITNPTPYGAGINSKGNDNQISGVIASGLAISGSNQVVAQNYITNQYSGIECTGSYNQIIENTLSDAGISLSGSYNNVAENNILNNNGIGIMLTNASTNLIINNVISKGGASLLNSNFNTIYNNTITSGQLWLGDYPRMPASNNLITGNTMEDASIYGWAVLVGYGSNNVFYGNLIANNGGIGLALGGIDIEVDNNLFYCNNFMNNSKSFGANWQVIGSNSFDNGTTGNYWDDYLTKYPNATEVDDSGIGNTPYLVYGNVTDDYPLMNAFNISNVNIQLPTWISSLPSLLPLPSFPSPSLPSSPSSSPTPSPTASPSPSPSPTPLPTQEPFPIALVAIASGASAVAVCLGLLVYFKKRKH